MLMVECDDEDQWHKLSLASFYAKKEWKIQTLALFLESKI